MKPSQPMAAMNKPTIEEILAPKPEARPCIPAFTYLSDFRENTLQDIITKIEPDLFLIVTGLTVKDFHLLVSLKVFNTEQMNQAAFAFRRYEDATLRYTGIESHPGLTHYGLYDAVVTREEASPY